MSDAACNGRDVLFTRNLGKRNREPQPAPASRSYLHGISGRYTADAEIRRLVAHSLGSSGNICRHDVRFGRHCCDPSADMLGICFGLYALAYGMQSTLDYSLPNQLFPTAVRATAVGMVLVVSRVASILAAAGFPLLLKCCNVSEIFVLVAGVVTIGIIATRLKF